MSREVEFQSIQAVGENTIKFRLSPSHVSYANTLVRLMMTGVECVGFRADIGDDGATSDVIVEANTTPMTNEMLAHRIGLLPVYMTEPKKWEKDEYEFHLDIVNDSDEPVDVKASDIRVLKVDGDQKVQVPYRTFFPPDPITKDTCLIASLNPKHQTGKPEEIRLKAKASRGVGRENARFIPTSQCTYIYTLDDDEAHIKEVRNNWLLTNKKIPAEQFDQMPEEKREALLREFKTLGIKRCYLKNELGEPYSFDFTVESAGVLSPLAIVKEACEAGIRMCSHFGDDGGDTLPEDVLVQPTNKRLLGFDFVFQKQDHTLGNLLQTWIDQNHVENGDVTFVGYMVPHPLRDEMVLTIGIADGNEETARRVLKEAARGTAAMFRDMSDKWSGKTDVKQVTTGQAKNKTGRRPISRLPST